MKFSTALTLLASAVPFVSELAQATPLVQKTNPNPLVEKRASQSAPHFVAYWDGEPLWVSTTG